MAKLTIKMPEDFLNKVSRLAARTDDILPRVLEAGAEIVEKKARSNLASVIGKGTAYPSRTTGALLSALGTSPAKMDRNGNYNVKIGFAEPRAGGESNAKIANVLEYGKVGQPPKPFMKPAVSASKSACIEAMKAKLEQEVAAV